MWTILRTLIWQQYYSCFPDGWVKRNQRTANGLGQAALNVYRLTLRFTRFGVPGGACLLNIPATDKENVNNSRSEACSSLKQLDILVVEHRSDAFCWPLRKQEWSHATL